MRRFLSGIRPGGQVLDVACGSGRHIAECRRLGLEVVGVDRDIAAASAAFGTDPNVRLLAADLEGSGTPPFTRQRFDGVIVTNYLWRPLLPAIVAAVAEDGVLIYETFAVGQERLGRPSNPEFLLRPGELLEAVAGRLVPVAYEHVELLEPKRRVQRIAAVGAAHQWVAEGTK
ncbi:MAG: class I SAM-dependent methyltransferase [Proteobacteria bacterium]|nr:class I SAM-dependent methyltransferase [Pseudomonadota bacterium]